MKEGPGRTDVVLGLGSDSICPTLGVTLCPTSATGRSACDWSAVSVSAELSLVRRELEFGLGLRGEQNIALLLTGGWEDLFARIEAVIRYWGFSRKYTALPRRGGKQHLPCLSHLSPPHL